MREHRGAVPGREDTGVGGRFKGRMYRGEAVLVGGEPRCGKPRLCAGLRDPEHLVERVRRAAGGVQHGRICGFAGGFVIHALYRGAGRGWHA